jgi:hypothetical protein
MPKLLVLANLEMAFDIPEGVADPEAVARKKERRLLRLLRKLAAEDPEVAGTLESLEYEGFGYSSDLMVDSSAYYYNKHENENPTAETQ